MSVCVELHLKNKNVLIVGGGNVAYRKALQYVQEEAHVTVVSPNILEPLQKLPIKIHLREYEIEDLKDMIFVFAATNVQHVNESILEDAKKLNILSGCATHHELASISSMVCIEDSDVLCAISTHGKYPFYNQTLKKEIQHCLQHKDTKIKLLDNLRKAVLAQRLDSTILLKFNELSPEEISFFVNALHTRKVKLLAFHGVVNNDLIASLYKDCDDFARVGDSVFGFVFLSEKVQVKVQHKISNLEVMLSLLHNLHIDQISVYPMLLTDGKYFEQAKRICENENIVLHQALLRDPLILNEIVDAYVHHYQKDNQLVFISHDHYPTKIEHNLRKSIKRFSNVFLYSFQDQITLNKKQPILLIPFVMMLGHHASKDILHGADSVYARLKHQGYHVDMLCSSMYDQQFIKDLYIEKFK